MQGFSDERVPELDPDDEVPERVPELAPESDSELVSESAPPSSVVNPPMDDEEHAAAITRTVGRTLRTYVRIGDLTDRSGAPLKPSGPT
jgi:hypothetical protein